jgi:hypothetical protein
MDALKIRVAFFDLSLTTAAVHVVPIWLERLLFGEREFDAIVITRGGVPFWESSGRLVGDRRIRAAIHSARAAGARKQHHAALLSADVN